jgi:predicted permease
MGAGRARIIRQIMTESMMLALLGGVAGLVLGYSLSNFIPHLFDDPWQPSSVNPQMDVRVFLFNFAVTIATGLLFGIGPAWRSTRTDANEALKETTRMSTGYSKALLGKALVVLQVALSLVLVVGAGLFVRTLLNLRSVPTGINPEHIVLFQLFPPRSHYTPAQQVVLFQRISEGLATVPRAQLVTSSSEPLLAQSMDNDCFRPTGRPAGPPQQDTAFTNYIGANFFDTFSIPILAGRPVTLKDGLNAPKVAVINQTLAKAFFPNENAVGRTITTCDAKPSLIQVVGVSRDAKYSDLREPVPSTIYLPYAQASDLDRMTFEIKTVANLASVVPKIREVVRKVDKDLPVLEIRTQTEQIDALLSGERSFAMLTSGFGLLALVLASIGIYGVMAYTVARRTNEIGIRMALGAEARTVLSMVLGETSLLACLGIVAGLAGALAATRLVTSMLFGVHPTDAATFIAAAALLLFVALLAALVPAWRAATVDPMRALRHE